MDKTIILLVVGVIAIYFVSKSKTSSGLQSVSVPNHFINTQSALTTLINGQSVPRTTAGTADIAQSGPALIKGVNY